MTRYVRFIVSPWRYPEWLPPLTSGFKSGQGYGKVLVRLMRNPDAAVKDVAGQCVVIRVPWVGRYARPVFVNGDLFCGTFRRTRATISEAPAYCGP